MKLNWNNNVVNMDYETFADDADVGDIILGIDYDGDRWAAIKTNRDRFVTIASNKESTITIGIEETLEEFINNCHMYNSQLIRCDNCELNVPENFLTKIS
jgi:hypothetical protein